MGATTIVWAAVPVPHVPAMQLIEPLLLARHSCCVARCSLAACCAILDSRRKKHLLKLTSIV